MKHILMIGTGGTIASQIGQDGLRPALTSEQLLCFVPKVSEFCRVDCIQLFSLDSTNIRPENWVALAKAIQENYDRYDGFVVSHGTDTMAYTAAALSYLIQGAKKPIILTGAQKPISFDSTDSKINLTDAFLCAASDRLHGVMIVFNGKVIQGTRACKTRSKSYEAFSSINYPYLAVLQDGSLLQYIENAYLDAPVFSDRLDGKVDDRLLVLEAHAVELADAAEQQNAVHAGVGKVVEVLAPEVVVDFALVVRNGDGRAEDALEHDFLAFWGRPAPGCPPFVSL